MSTSGGSFSRTTAARTGDTRDKATKPGCAGWHEGHEDDSQYHDKVTKTGCAGWREGHEDASWGGWQFRTSAGTGSPTGSEIKEGASPATAHERLSGAGFNDKNELLFQRGINFNEVPQWQRRGAGLLWENYEKHAVDPRTSEPVAA